MQKIISNTFEHKIHAQVLKICHKVELQLHQNNLGPRLFAQHQKVMMLILYKRSGYTYRRFIEQLYETRWPTWLQLKQIPSKSTLHRWMQQFSSKLLHKFQQLLVKAENTMAIDATGIDSWQRSRHYERRIGAAPMPYAKLDVLIDTENKLILDHVLRLKPRHDTVAATQLFKRCRFAGECLGDKGYDSEPLHEIARKHEIELHAPVRASPRKRPRGRFRRQCAKGITNYSKRNTVESVIHSLKAVHLPSLRSKLWWMKKKEVAFAILVYNLERVVSGKVSTIQITVVIQIVIWDTPSNPKTL